MSSRSLEFCVAPAGRPGPKAPRLGSDRPRPPCQPHPTHSRSHTTPSPHRSPPVTAPRHTIPQTQPKMCTSNCKHGSPRGHAIPGIHHCNRSPITLQRSPPLRHTHVHTHTHTHAHAHTRREPDRSARRCTLPHSPQLRSPPLLYLLRRRTRSAGSRSPSSAPPALGRARAAARDKRAEDRKGG